jgi:conjugal transfer/type IV secretion protein DotA/TraY
VAISSSDAIEDFVHDIDLKRINETIDASIGPTGIRFAAQALQAVADGATVVSFSVGQGIADAATALILQPSILADINNFNVSPIERVRHLGVTVTNGFLAANTMIAVAKAFADGGSEATKHGDPTGFMAVVVGLLKGLVSFLESFLMLLMEISGPLLAGAFVCANIIPAMPYIMLLVAAIGYAIYVVEALVGVNLWSFSVGNPDGHDVWGRGGQGWGTILTLALRPLLIVIGFFIGIAFNWIFGHWINATIVPSFQMQNSNTMWVLGNLSQFAGLLVVFSGLHLFSAWKGFSLSWELPNAILRWLGIQDHQDLGEREAKENALAVAMPVGGGAARSLEKNVAGLAKKMNSGKDGENKKGGKENSAAGEDAPKGGGGTEKN